MHRLDTVFARRASVLGGSTAGWLTSLLWPVLLRTFRLPA